MDKGKKTKSSYMKLCLFPFKFKIALFILYLISLIQGLYSPKVEIKVEEQN